MKLRTKIIICLIIAALLGFALGYIYGFGQGVEWTVKLGMHFVDVDVDVDKLVTLLLSYKDAIDYHYPG